MRKVYAMAQCTLWNAGRKMRSRKGMELVQVGILIAIAVGLGLIFKEKITGFVNQTFNNLLSANFGR